jgi:glucose-6-phosphate 1-dehydrogenase
MSVAESFGEGAEAYERLIHDALEGDARLFARQDSVEEAWRIFDDAIKAAAPVSQYEFGSWGPTAADRLLVGNDVWHAEHGMRGHHNESHQ